MLDMVTILDSFVLLKLTVGDIAPGLLTGPAAEIAWSSVLSCVFFGWRGAGDEVESAVPPSLRMGLSYTDPLN